MKKVCAICNKKVNWKGKLIFADGYVCNKCCEAKGWTKLGSYTLLSWSEFHTVKEFEEFVANGGTEKDAKEIWKKKERYIKPQQKTSNSSNPHALEDRLAENEVEKIKSWGLDERIEKQLIDAKVFDLFLVKKELKYLAGVIEDNETIKYACSGNTNGRSVLVVCTNTRIIFIDKHFITGMEQEEIPLDYVNAVTFTQGVTLGKICVTNGATTTLIENVNRFSAPIMAKTIREAAKTARQGGRIDDVSTATNTNANQISSLDTLKKLKELADAGVLTQEEFETKKKEILQNI